MEKFDKRIVVKVGTNVMTNRDNRIVGPVLRNLIRQISWLYEHNMITALVSSGSAIAGKEVLGTCLAENETTRRQIYSSVGQPRLMRHYYSMFHDIGMRCAQILATKRDFAHGEYRDNMTNCYEALINEGIIPIANEDDTVSLTNSMFTDNDELASLVAELIGADMMILLTDIDGLFTGHPGDENSELITHVGPDQDVEQYVQESKKAFGEGRGGMKSKIRIAKKTAKNGIPTYIANGKDENIIIDIVKGLQKGTLITADYQNIKTKQNDIAK